MKKIKRQLRFIGKNVFAFFEKIKRNIAIRRLISSSFGGGFYSIRRNKIKRNKLSFPFFVVFKKTNIKIKENNFEIVVFTDKKLVLGSEQIFLTIYRNGIVGNINYDKLNYNIPTLYYKNNDNSSFVFETINGHPPKSFDDFIYICNNVILKNVKKENLKASSLEKLLVLRIWQHGDMHYKNVLISGNKAIVVDFDDISFDLWFCDLFRFLLSNGAEYFDSIYFSDILDDKLSLIFKNSNLEFKPEIKDNILAKFIDTHPKWNSLYRNIRNIPDHYLQTKAMLANRFARN